jgi:iron complex transport system substrate-binding protein
MSAPCHPVKAGLEVHVFNQHDIDGILRMIRMLGALVGAEEKAQTLTEQLCRHIRSMRSQGVSLEYYIK